MILLFTRERERELTWKKFVYVERLRYWHGLSCELDGFENADERLHCGILVANLSHVVSWFEV